MKKERLYSISTDYLQIIFYLDIFVGLSKDVDTEFILSPL